LREAFDAPVPPGVLEALAGTRRGLRERLAHRAWGFRSTKLRTAVLVWERYRRQKALPPGPTTLPGLRPYLRRWAAMVWGTRRTEATRSGRRACTSTIALSSGLDGGSTRLASSGSAPSDRWSSLAVP